MNKYFGKVRNNDFNDNDNDNDFNDNDNDNNNNYTKKIIEISFIMELFSCCKWYS